MTVIVGGRISVIETLPQTIGRSSASLI